MSTRQADEQPTPVPHKAKPAGEIQDRWSWVEPSVWTERMLKSDPGGLVCVLPAQSSPHLWPPGRLDTYASAQYPSISSWRLRPRARVRSSPLAQCFLCRPWVVLPYRSPPSGLSIRSAVNHRLESRMREIRTYGSEQGVAGQPAVPTPISLDPGSESGVTNGRQSRVPRGTVPPMRLLSRGTRDFTPRNDRYGELPPQKVNA